MSRRATLAVVALAAASASCFAPRYLAQAGYGELDILTSARPIQDVIDDPDTDVGTRTLLLEVAGVKDYAREVGLRIEGNYGKYIELDRSAAVYFIAASKPLAFEPKVWCWPIVGCFPNLSWFSLEDAEAHKKQLEADGWEAYVRGAGAFSTGGWFRDPIVSSMFREGENIYGDFINVILHELMHVNVLVRDQAYFNESIAAYTADGMATTYLERRFGADSFQALIYAQDLEQQRLFGETLWKAYRELDDLYKSPLGDDVKRARKKEVIDRLMTEVPFTRRPNNAALIGFRTYNTGFDDFDALRVACGGSWPRFLAAVKSIRSSDFSQPLAEDFASAVQPLVKAGCMPRR
jgi:predicted aminopeptidase